MQSQPPGRKDKQCAVSVQWSCDIECCTGHHTEHDLQWRHKPAATSLLTKLWLWGSLEVCWSFHKGNCNCSWRLLFCTMWWCAVLQLVVNIYRYCLLLNGMQLTCTTLVESLNPLTLNDLLRRHAVSLSKIKIPRKNLPEKPTNTPIIHSVY
jgi:hypothetical protein